MPADFSITDHQPCILWLISKNQDKGISLNDLCFATDLSAEQIRSVLHKELIQGNIIEKSNLFFANSQQVFPTMRLRQISPLLFRLHSLLQERTQGLRIDEIVSFLQYPREDIERIIEEQQKYFFIGQTEKIDSISYISLLRLPIGRLVSSSPAPIQVHSQTKKIGVLFLVFLLSSFFSYFFF